jgi:radical SAM superfamily enzyme YgiQ (UPF0313 family)
MKLDIIVVYMQRYRKGHEVNFVPPITGIHLAAITPPQYQVRVVHQQVQPVVYDTDADLVALSFFSGFAAEAYRLAQIFRSKGKMVIAGGPHATFYPEETLEHCDAVVIGEAESVWEKVLADAQNGKLDRRYEGTPPSLDHIPTPRYELLPGNFFIKKVVQATRGCPFTCTFCSVPELNPGFRVRPVTQVIQDISYDRFTHWWQNKVVWFWDDNLAANRPYIKELLRAMIPHKKWWLTQASMDIARDPELLDLMEKSGCIGVFFGIETFDSESLREANKRQNKIEYYRACIEALHRHGIAVMAGLIAGFDGDTVESIERMALRLEQVGVDVPFISILTPYKGTPLYAKLLAEGRILRDRSWEFYNGYNVVFQPKNMSARELTQAHRTLWKKAFSPAATMKRIARAMTRLRLGAFLLALFMNVFYCAKRVRYNLPVDWSVFRPGE